MESSDLTSAQCHVLMEKVREMQTYVRRVMARMRDQGFPHNDRLAREYVEIEDKLQGLWVTLHYLSCRPGTTGRPRKPQT